MLVYKNMNKNILLVLLAVIVIGGGVYWAFAEMSEDTPTNTETTSQSPVTSGENGGGVHNMPVEPAAAAARADLATKLGVSATSITIMMIEDKTWTDGCLGLGGPAESCLQALVDGFRVEMLAQGETYFYRTDKTGASLRAEN